MDNKRYLKKFNSQSDYESQKDSVMGMPHVVLLDDTKEVVFASENNEDEIDYSLEFFTIEALEDDTIVTPNVISLINSICDVYYAINDNEFNKLEVKDYNHDGVIDIIDFKSFQNGAHGIILNKNDKVRFKFSNVIFTKELYDYDENMEEIIVLCNIFGLTDNIFIIDKKFKCYGNILSLLYGDEFLNYDLKQLLDYTSIFYKFFNKDYVVNAENLILPNIITENCYSNMFRDCTSLTKAPELPATTLATKCYNCMFYGCSNLNYIKMLATDISANKCLNNWVSGVASSGTFVKNAAMTSLPSGTSGIPNGWTVENA